MKFFKKIYLFSLVLFFICLMSCNQKKKNSVSFDLENLPTQKELSQKSEPVSKKVDLDLTQMNANMIYAEVFNMLIEPENYENKNIKISGYFNIFTNENTNEKYYAIIIPDALECCQQGLELVWLGEHSLDEYPSQGEKITIVGRYTIRELENGITYNYLAVSEI